MSGFIYTEGAEHLQHDEDLLLPADGSSRSPLKRARAIFQLDLSDARQLENYFDRRVAAAEKSGKLVNGRALVLPHFPGCTWALVLLEFVGKNFDVTTLKSGMETATGRSRDEFIPIDNVTWQVGCTCPDDHCTCPDDVIEKNREVEIKKINGGRKDAR